MNTYTDAQMKKHDDNVLALLKKYFAIIFGKEKFEVHCDSGFGTYEFTVYWNWDKVYEDFTDETSFKTLDYDFIDLKNTCSAREIMDIYGIESEDLPDSNRRLSKEELLNCSNIIKDIYRLELKRLYRKAWNEQKNGLFIMNSDNELLNKVIEEECSNDDDMYTVNWKPASTGSRMTSLMFVSKAPKVVAVNKNKMVGYKKAPAKKTSKSLFRGESIGSRY